jgi:TRAP-type mannitol/chloroaromatic compound transport system permease small subunit
MSPLKVDLDLEAVESAASRGHALDFPETAISRAIDRVIVGLAGVFNWIWVILVLLIVINVALRYVLGTNFIAMEEMQWHLFAVGFMMGLGYALDSDGHVRVDVVAEKFSRKTRAWIELIGLLLIVFPLVYIIITNAWPFVTRAYAINEVSAAPGGLPYRWIIKSVIIVAFVYLGLAALSRVLRVTAQLFGVPRPIAR